MSDENPPQETDLREEFQAIGEQLKEMLKVSWDRPERKALQYEIEQGLNELGRSLRQASDEFSESDAGKRVKTGVEDLRQRVHSGDIEKTIRKDLGNALNTLRNEIQKLTERLKTPGDQDVS